MEPAVAVHVAVGAEGFHHGLVESLGVEGVLQNNGAVRHHRVHISVLAAVAGHQVPLVVAAHRAGGIPVLLRVHQHRIVLGGVKIQHGRQHLIGDLDELHGLQGGLFRLRGDDGHHIPHKTDVPVDDQPVVGGGFGEGLARDGEPVPGHILPGENLHHAGHLFGGGGVDGLYQGVGVGASQQLDHQGIPGDILCVHRLAQKQLHGILFPDGFSNGFQFFLFHSCLLTSGCSENSECPGAGRRSRSSGTDSPPGRRGFRHPWGRGFPGAGRWCSSQSRDCRSRTGRRPGRR